MGEEFLYQLFLKEDGNKQAIQQDVGFGVKITDIKKITKVNKPQVFNWGINFDNKIIYIICSVLGGGFMLI